MKKVVVVADDFGLCESVNDGIIDSYKNGIVTELSLMVGSPATDDAITKARKNDISAIGLHCLLTFWKDNGDITRRDDYKKLFAEASEAEIEKLFQEEIRLFIKLVGSKPTHVTGQYSIHGNPKLLKAVMKYCKESDTPMRIPRSPLISREEFEPEDIKQLVEQVRVTGCRTTDHTFGHMLGDYDKVEQLFIHDLETIQEDESAEILLHPGDQSDYLSHISSLTLERSRDVLIAKSKKLRQALTDYNTQVVEFKDIF